MSPRVDVGTGLAVGVGLRPGADPAELVALLDRSLAGLWLPGSGGGRRTATRADVAALSTLTARVGDAAVLRLGEALGLTPIACEPVELAMLMGEQLPDTRSGPAGLTRSAGSASVATWRAVGTPAVAEPAALLAACRLGSTPQLLLGKQIGPGVTLAVATATS